MIWIRQFLHEPFLVLALAGLSGCWINAQATASAQPPETKAVVRYTDAAYGLSLVYPRNFVLNKGDLTSTNDLGKGFLGTLGMAFVQDGGVRIATVEIPQGSYPNTDFVNTFFSVGVHQGLTAEKCAQFAPEQGFPKIATRKVSGIGLEGIDDSEGAMGHQFTGRSYHGFSGGRCSELTYGLATAGFGAVDGRKHVDDKAIMGRLESILLTIKIAPPLAHPSREAPAQPGAQKAFESASLKQVGPVLVSIR